MSKNLDLAFEQFLSANEAFRNQVIEDLSTIRKSLILSFAAVLMCVVAITLSAYTVVTDSLWWLLSAVVSAGALVVSTFIVYNTMRRYIAAKALLDSLDEDDLREKDWFYVWDVSPNRHGSSRFGCKSGVRDYLDYVVRNIPTPGVENYTYKIDQALDYFDDGDYVMTDAVLRQIGVSLEVTNGLKTY